LHYYLTPTTSYFTSKSLLLLAHISLSPPSFALHDSSTTIQTNPLFSFVGFERIGVGEGI
jgi:hypothetical protein